MPPIDPMLSRRRLLQVGAVTLSGSPLALFPPGLRASSEEKAQPRGSADCVVFVNLVGGPSQMDTFDLKESKTTPSDLDVRTAPNGTRWPYGLLPATAGVLNDTVLVRSMAAWETLHNFGQFYQQV